MGYHQDLEIVEMEQQGKRNAWVNGTLIVLNILYFLYLETAGTSEDTLFMLRHGAMYTPLIVQKGQYYRLLTSMFMHFGIHHIANNMLVLFILGDKMERALGSIKYMMFYLLCGLGANIISMILGMGDSVQAVSAGASGAIFGVIGGLLYVVAVNHGRLEDINIRQLVIMILFSLYFGLTNVDIDNMAHLGGLAAGFIIAMILYRKPLENANPKIRERLGRYDNER